jgi:hypothetical protein
VDQHFAVLGTQHALEALQKECADMPKHWLTSRVHGLLFEVRTHNATSLTQHH